MVYCTPPPLLYCHFHTAMVASHHPQADDASNQLANHLITSCGVTEGDVIGLMMPRCHTMMLAMLGILKAGGAYLPLDPGHPPSRTAFIVEDAGLKVGLLIDLLPRAYVLLRILTGTQFTLGSMHARACSRAHPRHPYPAFEVSRSPLFLLTLPNSPSLSQVIVCAEDLTHLLPPPSQSLVHVVLPATSPCLNADVAAAPTSTPGQLGRLQDLAYVIYTSGSTGEESLVLCVLLCVCVWGAPCASLAQCEAHIG